MALIRVQREDFDPGAEIAAIAARRPGAGALGSFLGLVRSEAHGRPITAMTLEHYPAMTERAIGAIVREAERRWRLVDVTIVHRFGRLVPGERIVLVLVLASHREPALAATSFLIDWLKTKAPFWKKEQFTDGEAVWVEAKEEDEAAARRWEAAAERVLS